MEESDKLRLRGNIRYLIGQIRVGDIKDFLYEKGVLSEDDYEELEHGRQTERNSVRKLLTMLFKKGPRTYTIFCTALNEAGYDHVVKKLEDTDPANVHLESQDELDTFMREEGQIAEFQRRLWNTTEMLEQYKRELDDIKQKMNTKEEKESRYSTLEKEIRNKGYSEEFVIGCLEDYMSRSQLDDPDSGRALDVPGQSLRPPLSPMRHGSGNKDQINRIALELSRDVVFFMTCKPSDLPPEPNRYAKVMRKTVQLMTETKADVFESFINKLCLTDANGFQMLENVADELFRVGKNNWGRIIALYAFGGFVAKHASANKMNSISTYIGDYLGKYVAKNLSQWIDEKGGWDDFEAFFRVQEESGSMGWTGLFLTAISLGALVSLASVKGSM